MKRESTEHSQGSETIEYGTTVANVCHYVFVEPPECSTGQMNSNVKQGAVMMSQCRFMELNECTTVLWYMGSWGGCRRGGSGSIWELCVFGITFCCEPQTVLPNKVY